MIVGNFQNNFRGRAPARCVRFQLGLDRGALLAPDTTGLRSTSVYSRPGVQVRCAEECLSGRHLTERERLSIACARKAEIALAIDVSRDSEGGLTLPIRPDIGMLAGVLVKLSVGSKAGLDRALVTVGLIVVERDQQPWESLPLEHIDLRIVAPAS